MAGITYKGCRDNNEDRILIGDVLIDDGSHEAVFNDSLFIALCDGVGGEAYGEVAAEVTLNSLSKDYNNTLDIKKITDIIHTANKCVIDKSRSDRKYRGMSSTLVGAFFDKSGVIGFNVGDSRLYRYRKPYIAQLSVDHSFAEVFRCIDEEERKSLSHVITRYIGGDKCEPYIYDGSEAVFDGDVFMLCSDGISDVLSDVLLSEMLDNNDDVSILADNIVSSAMDHDSKDNISIIIVKVKE